MQPHNTGWNTKQSPTGRIQNLWWGAGKKFFLHQHRFLKMYKQPGKKYRPARDSIRNRNKPFLRHRHIAPGPGWKAKEWEWMEGWSLFFSSIRSKHKIKGLVELCKSGQTEEQPSWQKNRQMQKESTYLLSWSSFKSHLLTELTDSHKSCPLK